ncbi:MAG: hypothetical protein V1688_03420 [bacterium]
MKQTSKNFLVQFNKDVFTVSMISFVALFLLELIKPKFVIAYINLNCVLLLCLMTGIFTVLFEKQTQAEENNVNNPNKDARGVLLVLSIITFVFIMFFTYDLGMWGVLISFGGGMVAFLLGLTLE